MAVFETKDFSFAYPNAAEPAVKNLSFSLMPGEFYLLCGESGCGKTTFLRHLKPAVAPYGKKRGQIFYEGIPMDKLEKRRASTEIGFVFQSPEAQIVTDRVSSELAFGLENAGIQPGEIRLRVAEMASFFGLENWYDKKVEELSGGQKQLLNLAAVMAARPRVLILDEPTAQLDPVSAGTFISMLEKLNRELGQTVLLTEHRMEDLFPLADRVGLMEQGRITEVLPPEEMARYLLTQKKPLAKALPTPARTAWDLGMRDSLPLTVKEGRRFLSSAVCKPEKKKKTAGSPKVKKAAEAPEVLKAKGIFFRYYPDGRDILKDFSFCVEKGSFWSVLGGNGAGKTTLLKVLAGILPPYRGKVKKISPIGYLCQNPRSVFLKDTLEEDFSLVQSRRELWMQEMEKEPLFQNFSSLLSRNPMDLSGGELQKAALFKVLLSGPEILLLDEPTKGLDPLAKEELGGLLMRLQSRGKSLVLVTHDIEFSARYASACAFLFDGRIVSQGEPVRFFSANQFYTTAACKMCRDILEGAATVEEVVRLASGNGA